MGGRGEAREPERRPPSTLSRETGSEGGGGRVPGDSGESPARPSEDDEARPLPLPKLKPWSGWVRQGPSCSRAEQRTGNTTEPAHPDAGPTRTRSSARSPCAHSTRRDTQPASRTRRLWNLREPVVAAPPSLPPRARARRSPRSAPPRPAKPSPAPPRPAPRALSNAQLSRIHQELGKSNASSSQPGKLYVLYFDVASPGCAVAVQNRCLGLPSLNPGNNVRVFGLQVGS